MANVDGAFGARPLRYISGAPYTGAANQYNVPTGSSTALGIGSFVKLTGTVSTLTLDGRVKILEDIQEATITDAHSLLGVVVGFIPDYSDLSIKHRATSTARVALVAEHPDLVYEIQEDESTTDTDGVLWSEAGLNAHIVLGAVDTTTGRSAHELDSDTPAADNNGQLRILGPVLDPSNETASTGKTNTRWEVMINLHQRKLEDDV